MNGRIVSNAGPIIALATIGKLGVLRRIFDEVIVPQAVHQEILEGGRELAGLKYYEKATWIKVETPKTAMDPLLETILDKGEAAVIHVCREQAVDIALIDERKARKIARQVYGLKVVGSARILLEAKRRGLLPNVRDALLEMRTNGYWIHDDIVRAVLKRANEDPHNM